MKLTEHFRLGEFTRSASAKAHDIDNSVPDVETAMRLAALCVCILEPLREHVGHPIRISSGYRCPELNAIVHGLTNGQGQRLTNTDILNRWFTWIMDHCDFDQLIKETSDRCIYWIHVSCKRDRTKNRHQVIRFLQKRGS